MRDTNPEHPCIIEIDGKKYLRPEWDVHHEGFDKTIVDPEKLPPMEHKEHARMHIRLREEAKNSTIEEWSKILANIVKETIEKEYFY